MQIRSLLVFGAMLIAVASWYFSSTGEYESFHPFRSEQAKSVYLEYYNERAQRLVPAGESRTIPTSFGDTHVRVSGPMDSTSSSSSSSTPLVLLPGDSETLLDWESQLPVLSKHYRTYAIDNVYDFGKSVFSRPMKVPNDYVQWLEELFRGLDIDKAHLIGFSYGGWISSLFALAHSERLFSLVLIAPPSTVIAPSWELLFRGILQWVFPTKWIVHNYLSWYHPDSSQQDVNDRVDELLLSTSCFKRRGMVPPTVLTDNEWQQLSTELPVLFMVGNHEITYSASQAIERLASFNVATRLIPNAGHDIRTIQADLVNREILSFLETVEQG